MNITPVTVRLVNSAELTILGEQEVCLATQQDGDLDQGITLRFPYPYGGRYDKPVYWETGPIIVKLARGKTTTLLLCPRMQDRNYQKWLKVGWHQMWVLSPPESRFDCGPAYAR